jgi:Xaa-Pro aminopeptidase
MDYDKRLEGLQSKMEEKDLDLSILSPSPSFQYLTGTSIEWRRGLDLLASFNHVLIPLTGEPTLMLTKNTALGQESWIKDQRILEEASEYEPMLQKVVNDLDPEPNKIGLGKYCHVRSVLSVARVCKGALFYEAENLMDDLRMIKEDEELRLLNNAAKLTDSVMKKIIPEVGEGATQRELSLRIEMTGRKLGASDVSFPSTAGFVKTGSGPSDQPFTYPPQKGLEKGSSIAFDVGFVLGGYCSDWGRSLYIGDAEPDVKTAYESLQNAVSSTIDEIEPHVTAACDIFPSIEEKLDADGYGKYMRARLKDGTVGHQIGVEVHENPWLKPQEKTPLSEGMVFCIEPKLWDKGRYYLRVEDMVQVKSDGAVSLTHYDREQFLI